MSSLRINISKLSEGKHHHSLSTEPSDLGLDKRFVRKVSTEVDIEKSNRQLLVQVESESGGMFLCDRCLDEFQRDVQARYTILYVQGEQEPDRAEEVQEEVQYLSVDTNIIDLGEDVRQFLILSLPLKMLCKEDCAGLCPVCGINKNKATCSCTVQESDPRWAELKKLMNN